MEKIKQDIDKVDNTLVRLVASNTYYIDNEATKEQIKAINELITAFFKVKEAFNN